MIKDFYVGKPVGHTYKPTGLPDEYCREMADVFVQQVHRIAVGEGINPTDIRVWFIEEGRSGCSDLEWTVEKIMPWCGDYDYEPTAHLLIISEEDLRDIPIDGMREYAHLKYLLPDTFECDEGLLYFAAHEATHIYDAHVNDGVGKWSHDENFEREYARFIQTYILEA